MNKEINEIELKKILKSFFSQAKRAKEQKTTKDTSTTEISNKIYKGMIIEASFGQGRTADIPWITFLQEPFTTSNGVYPYIGADIKNGEIKSYIGFSVKNTVQISTQANEEINKINNQTYHETISDFNNISNEILDKLINYLNKIISEFQNIFLKINDSSRNNEDDNLLFKSLNKILYGPPGTGKTYQTINKALEIILEQEPNPDIKGLLAKEIHTKEDREQLRRYFDYYKKQGQIEFITFHQSYGYEEFIEGIKAATNSKEEIVYVKEDGLFKKIAQRALCSQILITQENIKTLDFDEIYKDLIDKIEKKEINRLKTKTQEEIEIVDISINDNITFKHFDGIKKYLVSKERLKKLFEHFDTKEKFQAISNINDEFRAVIGGCNSSGYWAVLNYVHDHHIETILESIDIENMTVEDQKELIKNFLQTPAKERKVKDSIKNYILIIDEINRGNISKIFGELITLIEPSKRVGQASNVENFFVKLPFTGDLFGIPLNLYIIGTMNTADRSIAQIDTALRRRFEFIEMLPKVDLLKDDNNLPIEIGENNEIIDVQKILQAMNERIEYIYDREHQIGHSYFMPLKDKSSKDTPKGKLDEIFCVNIIPLLAEYFYGDWADIKFVLNDYTDTPFITVKTENDLIFASAHSKRKKNTIYNVSGKEFNVKAYQNIYALKKI